MHIVLVEEAPHSQDRLRALLNRWSYLVTTAQNDEDAWQQLAQYDVDLVLMNCNLAEPADGFTVCRRIRQDASRSHLYVVLYTTTDSSADYMACMDAGADAFIGNPFDASALRVRMRAAERVIRRQRELAGENADLNTVNQRLGAAYSTLERDLRAGSELQFSLLPVKSDVHPSFNLQWLIVPCNFLAGDNLNYFMLQDRYLVFYLLDVSGHGVPSALLSVSLLHLLSTQPGSPVLRYDPARQLKRVVAPVEVVSELNQRFEAHGDTYFTMVYGVIDTTTREVTFCQAGHPSPLQIGMDRSITEVGAGGFPVGLWPNMTYDQTTLTLQAGEKLVLYSDGVVECRNRAGHPYSLERFQDVITQKAGSSLKDLLSSVRTDLEVWRDGCDSSDDISMLVIESR